MESLSNTLDKEQSLYLRQHAKNPVHWQPWSQSVFDLAQKENKPVLISIGYAACHWCHVMEHESFEDPYIADLMNKHFICVKVDREEHPEVDQLYMEAVMMINQHGGWPLNVFCLPDGRPFFGGTYFPNEDRGHGIVPWPQLLVRIASHYKRASHELEENADNILKNMVIANTPVQGNEQINLKPTLIGGAQHILKAYDPEHGGFSQAPKFPPSKIIDYLLEIRQTKAAENIYNLSEKIDTACYHTLTQMACGGLFDQIGGGFYRYSIDKTWTIPHFEKMLYDNGLLIEIYAKGYQRFQDPLFKDVIKETIDWLDQEMMTPEGLYAASLDADNDEGEGYYYTWSPEEIIASLGQERGQAFCQAYGVQAEGNFEKGKTHLCLNPKFKDKRNNFNEDRKKLLLSRQKRKAPIRDNKQLIAWNSLVATGLAHASFACNREDWLEKAKALINAIEQYALNNKSQLASVLYEGIKSKKGHLVDYAYYAQACLTLAAYIDVYRPGNAALYIKKAQQLIDVVLNDFKDPNQYGFYFTSKENEDLVTRKKEWWDSAMPAANSVLLECFSLLYSLTGDKLYESECSGLTKVYGPLLQQSPGGVANAGGALTCYLSGIAVVKIKDKRKLQSLQQELQYKPHRKIFIFLDTSLEQNSQLCIGTQCFSENNQQTLLEKIS